MKTRSNDRKREDERLRATLLRVRVRKSLLAGADIKAVAEGLSRPGMIERALQLYIR